MSRKRSMFRRTMTAALLALTLASAAALTNEAAQATGYPGATLSAGGTGVLYAGCWDQPYSFTVTLPAGATHWDLDVSVTGPDGLHVTGDYQYGSSDSPAPGSGGLQVCSYEMPGLYTVSAVLEWTDYSYNDHVTAVPSTSFVMRLPASATSMRPSTRNPSYGQRVTLRVSSKDERPAGFFANAYATVLVQRYASGRWATVKGGRLTTNSYGSAAMRYRFLSHRSIRLRAVTAGTSDFSESVSSLITLH